MQLNAPTSIAGAEKVALTIANYIDKERYKIFFGVFVSSKRPENAFVEELISRKLPHKIIWMNKTFDLSNLSTLRQVVKGQKIDLIHSHGYRANFAALIVGKTMDIPIISTVHGYTRVDRKVAFYERLDRLVLRFFDRVICVSDELAEWLCKLTLNKRTVHILPNTIDLKSLSDGKSSNDLRFYHKRDQENCVIGFLGRLSSEKGVFVLLRAAKLVLMKNPNVKFLIAGDGPMEEQLMRGIAELGIQEKFKLVGYVKDVYGFFQEIDALALPSLREGIPIAMLEAMFFWVPIITTGVGGMREVLNERSAIFVFPNNAEDLADKIISFSFDKEKYGSMVSTARARFDNNYHPSMWIGHLEKIYASTLNGGQ